MVATFLAFVVGYASIAFLLRYLANHSTIVFVVYRVGLGSLVLVIVSSRRDQPIALRPVQLAWKFGIVAPVALALTALPGGGSALDVVLTVLSIVFFAAIACWWLASTASSGWRSIRSSRTSGSPSTGRWRWRS